MVNLAALPANNANPDKSGESVSVQDVDGNLYQTVTLGGQTWLSENLRTTRFQDLSPVTSGFIPKDDEKYLATYGRLYSWVDVADERKLCPEGFRVATDDDWKELERHIGVAVEELHREGWRGDNDVAITLKAQQPDSWLKHFDKTKINAHQFNARPAGVKVGNWYLTQGVYTEFWTSSSASEKEAFARTLAYAWWNSHIGEIRRAKLNKNYMFSVRCVKEA